MVYKIIFKKRFENRLRKVLAYLEVEFGVLIAKKFADQVELKFTTLEQQPYMGRRSASFKNVRSILVGKQNRIYYRVESNKIIVMNMLETRMDAKRNKYEL
jgi:plasmid stabilization system protein ParE